MSGTQNLIDLPNGHWAISAVLTDASGNNYVAASPVSPATGTPTNVASSASDTTILASNASRKGATIYNDSTAILYVLLSTGTSSTTNYSLQLPSQGMLSIRVGEYTGVIKGIWASANGFARVTEFA